MGYLLNRTVTLVEIHWRNTHLLLILLEQQPYQILKHQNSAEHLVPQILRELQTFRKIHIE